MFELQEGDMQALAGERVQDLLDVTDEVLVKSAKAGDERAFEELMRRSWDQSVRLALCYLHDYEESMDEVQVAYLKAYTHLSTFSQKSKFSTWVGRIVINRCIMRLRAGKRAKVLSFDNTVGAAEGRSVLDKNRWSDPERTLGSHEISNLVQSELRRIPKLLRTPVELHHLHGLPLQEIADQLGVELGAVKTRVSRGNQYLRARMMRHLGQRGVATLTQ
jgi:RNA polymerase sigma-70 factor (ECF subfamily)